MPITVPAGVTVTIADGNVVTVKGPKGELTRALRTEMIIKQEGDTITVTRPSDDKLHRSLHGLTRTLLSNMIVGVTNQYTKELDVNGVILRTVDRRFTMKSGKEDLTLSGAALMSGILLQPTFRGTGYDHSQRTHGDFGSDIYIIEPAE